jgi:hypothetical protein
MDIVLERRILLDAPEQRDENASHLQKRKVIVRSDPHARVETVLTTSAV